MSLAKGFFWPGFSIFTLLLPPGPEKHLLKAASFLHA